MSKYTLGIDVGGTKIASGLVDAKGRVSAIVIQPTSQGYLLKQIESTISKYQGRFSAIGIGMPGPVSKSGIVLRLPNIKNFSKINLNSHLENKFKLKVKTINDAKAFTYAESVLGAGKKYKTVVGVTLGTGIGCALVSNKKIYYGPNQLAGEIGHIHIRKNETIEEIMHKHGPFIKADEAKPIVKILLSLIVGSLDPDVVVFTGGRMKPKGMDKVLKNSLHEVYKDKVKTKVVLSKLKYPGVIGAALLAK